eukprot:GDKI01009694.1.p2 GENE.GDKI01009694.1~~GDKI01009694.1.p2  ORF type:complete len:110 (-),score=11.55 GDKI01009694.1:157-486(-)
MFFLSRLMRGLVYREQVPYGVKKSKAYRDARKQERRALEAARRLSEAKGMILEGKKNLYMSLMENTGISWYRGQQILKYLEFHERGSIDVTPHVREKITEIAKYVKRGR